MDGLIDLYQYPPSDYGTRNFGYAKAAGDFNGDGLCDLAVSAPMYYSAPQWATGRVFIYSGNAALKDTVVANDDPVEAAPGWDINVYPNPIRGNDPIRINLLGSGYKQSKPLQLELYNLKGQKVSGIEYKEKAWDGTDISLTIPKIPSGLYILRIAQEGISARTKRICIVN